MESNFLIVKNNMLNKFRGLAQDLERIQKSVDSREIHKNLTAEKIDTYKRDSFHDLQEELKVQKENFNIFSFRDDNNLSIANLEKIIDYLKAYASMSIKLAYESLNEAKYAIEDAYYFNEY